MVKIKICKQGYLPAYWKGGQVALIPRYHPDRKPEQFIIEEVEVSDDISFPKIIDPEETSLAILKEICAVNHYPLHWFVNIITKDKITFQINGSDPLQKAIDYFIALNSAGTTTAQYRRIFADLIKGGVIDPRSSVESYLKQEGDKAEDASLSFSCLEDGSAKYYNYNDKIYYILRSFRIFLKNPHQRFVKKEKKPEEGKEKGVALLKPRHFPEPM